MAYHRDITERLLITDLDGSWFLWMGDKDGAALIEVPKGLADWIAGRPEMVALDHVGMWFEISSLPVTSVSAGQGRHSG